MLGGSHCTRLSAQIEIKPLIIHNTAFYSFLGSWKQNRKFCCCHLSVFFIFILKNNMEGWIGKAPWILPAGKVLCIALYWCLQTFVYLTQTIGCTRARTSPSVNCGLWVIIMYGRWVFACNERTTVQEVVDNERDYAEVGDRIIWESPILPSKICQKTKTDLKVNISK